MWSTSYLQQKDVCALPLKFKSPWAFCVLSDGPSRGLPPRPWLGVTFPLPPLPPAWGWPPPGPAPGHAGWWWLPHVAPAVPLADARKPGSPTGLHGGVAWDLKDLLPPEPPQEVEFNWSGGALASKTEKLRRGFRVRGHRPRGRSAAGPGCGRAGGEEPTWHLAVVGGCRGHVAWALVLRRAVSSRAAWGGRGLPSPRCGFSPPPHRASSMSKPQFSKRGRGRQRLGPRGRRRLARNAPSRRLRRARRGPQGQARWGTAGRRKSSPRLLSFGSVSSSRLQEP